MPLPEETFIHHVHLRVADLDRAISFYSSVLGLVEISRTGSQSFMSASGAAPAQLILTEERGVEPRNPFAPGLFHVAWRVPGRDSLAVVVRHFLSNQIRLQGFADHGVSEAVYLSDPEGNGIEVYFDRPRERWPRLDGRIEMVTEPLDVENLLQTLRQNDGPRPILAERTVIGHIHLQVSDLGTAKVFYHKSVGFDVTQDSFPGALFVAAGGYHHHIGLNIWNSRRSGPSQKVTAGLISFGIAVPGPTDVRQLRTRLEQAGSDISLGSDSFFARDPDHLQIEVIQSSPVVASPISAHV